jgi:hypothetical protein
MTNLRLSLCSVLALGVLGCGGSKSAPVTPDNTSTTTTEPAPGTPTPGSPVANEGESCGDGSMGTPNIACNDGLVCDTSGATPPPAGAAASGAVGVCKKAN